MLRFLRFGVHNVRLPRKTLPDEKIFTNLRSEFKRADKGFTTFGREQASAFNICYRQGGGHAALQR